MIRLSFGSNKRDICRKSLCLCFSVRWRLVLVMENWSNNAAPRFIQWLIPIWLGSKRRYGVSQIEQGAIRQEVGVFWHSCLRRPPAPLLTGDTPLRARRQCALGSGCWSCGYTSKSDFLWEKPGSSETYCLQDTLIVALLFKCHRLLVIWVSCVLKRAKYASNECLGKWGIFEQNGPCCGDMRAHSRF